VVSLTEQTGMYSALQNIQTRWLFIDVSPQHPELTLIFLLLESAARQI
jgi:hypothetical protein